MDSTDERIFISGVMELIQPHVDAYFYNGSILPGYDPDLDELHKSARELHEHLLKKFWDLSQNSEEAGSISIYMIPIMAYLKRQHRKRTK